MKLAKKGPQKLNDQIVSLGAFRYALGRRSYAVGATIEWLNDTYSQFEQNTRNVMIRDTVEALMDGYAGSKYDVAEWTQWASIKFAELEEEDKNWVKTATDHKQKEWPLEPVVVPNKGSLGDKCGFQLGDDVC